MQPGEHLVLVSNAGLYIFAPGHFAWGVVTPDEVVRSSIHVVRRPGHHAAVALSFTAVGSAAFCRLTRAAAERGEAVHRNQHFVVQVNGAIFGRPFVDYRAFPNGLCGTPGFEFVAEDPALAVKLAREIRRP